MYIRSILAVSILLMGISCSTTDTPAVEHSEEMAGSSLKAVAVMEPTEGSPVSGTVTFQEMDGHVHVSARLTGLEPGKHGFHIHEVGDCSAPDGTSAGGHFNPAGAPHGAPGSASHHSGDLGNILADENGNAEYHANLDFITLGPGENSVMGRSVIVHAAEDDLTSQPTGAAGARLACGIITAQ